MVVRKNVNGSVTRAAAWTALIAAWTSSLNAQTTSRVSVDGTGVQGSAMSQGASISADGRYVAFMSSATNLVAGDTNATWDVFVRDRTNGTTVRASVDSGGTEGFDDSFTPSISADGRYVAFGSQARLVAGDWNGYPDVYLRDLQSGTTEIVSNSLYTSLAPSISADGRFVAFESRVPSITEIFVKDRQTGTTEMVSVDSGGVQGNGESHRASISADGRYVAFVSQATNLVPGDTNGRDDIFVKDRQTGAIERVSLSSSGAQATQNSDRPSISADGRFVAFQTRANLVVGDANAVEDVFVRDRLVGKTERVSVDSAGMEGSAKSVYPSISGDDRFVAFTSIAANLVAGDTNARWDVFVRDRQLGTTQRASVDSAGLQGNSDSGSPSISANGGVVAFQSYATDLIPGADTNDTLDIFVRDLLGGPSFTSLCDPAAGGVIGCPCANPPSSSGRGCDNSASTGGAILSAAGGTFLSSDSLVFTTSGEKPTATSVLLQGTSSLAAGAAYGQGVRCVGGTLKRLFTKTASGGSITAPKFSAGDPTVSARSAAVGNPISAGESRWYLVFYRDPTVLGGCPATSTFNATQTGQIAWSP